MVYSIEDYRRHRSVKGFRQIDARGIWAGERNALRIFARAFHDDCQGNRETWYKVYGWTSEALEKAITQSEIVA